MLLPPSNRSTFFCAMYASGLNTAKASSATAEVARTAVGSHFPDIRIPATSNNTNTKPRSSSVAKTLTRSTVKPY